jgi:hypothetical protein
VCSVLLTEGERPATVGVYGPLTCCFTVGDGGFEIGPVREVQSARQAQVTCLSLALICAYVVRRLMRNDTVLRAATAYVKITHLHAA